MKKIKYGLLAAAACLLSLLCIIPTYALTVEIPKPAGNLQELMEWYQGSSGRTRKCVS